MKITLLLVGLVLVIFSHPAVSRFVMSRLFNEGIVTPRDIKPEKTEVVKYAGPNLSLFGVGVILIFLSLILRSA